MLSTFQTIFLFVILVICTLAQPLDDDGIKNINDEPVQVEESVTDSKSDAEIVILISSAHARFERRLWQRSIFRASGAKHMKFALMFLLDALSREDYEKMMNESMAHNDVYPSMIPPGLRLAERMLLGMTYAIQHHPSLKYVLFTDDDTVWCYMHLKYVLSQLELKYGNNIITGFVQRSVKFHVTYFDQHGLLAPRAVIDDILPRNSSLKCYPFGDASFQSWLHPDNGCQVKPVYLETKRNSLFPHTRSDGVFERMTQKNLCKHYLNLHYVRERSQFRKFENLYHQKYRTIIQRLVTGKDVSNPLKSQAKQIADEFQPLEIDNDLNSMRAKIKYFFHYEEEPCWLPEDQRRNKVGQEYYQGGL